MNPGSVGYYRVNYDADMLALLLQAVTDGSLDTRDRIQLIDDAFALVSYLYSLVRGLLSLSLSITFLPSAS